MRNYQDTSDERLISLYVGGCNEAFDELIDRHKDQVYSYIFHSVKNTMAAPDAFFLGGDIDDEQIKGLNASVTNLTTLLINL